VGSIYWCGEWRDKNITPEQEERRELARRIFVSMAGTEWMINYDAGKVWQIASNMANAEPNFSEAKE
jgi:hypothetical protein